ncbi:hypothetical protein JCM3766R1_002159 [Sporobolomyces carnicolor]
MKSFVLLLDPSTCDLELSTTSPRTNGPPDSKPVAARLAWDSWNGKAHKLLDQEPRIENLFWRQWHLEQRKKEDMYSQPHFPPTSQYVAGMQYRPNPPPLGATATVTANQSHFDRINEAGRQASRDLEAFLSNTLHSAQPPIVPNPPTFPPPIPPSPYSQLRQNLTNASPSPSVPHSHLVAPQPYRPAPFAQLPHQYQPSPEWAYNALPPISMPPPLPAASAAGVGQNRIIATPSWTALISDSSPQLQPQPQPQPQPAAANYYPPPPPPTAGAPSSATATATSSSSSNPQPPTLPPHSHSQPPSQPSHLSASAPYPNPTSTPYSFFSHPHSSSGLATLHTPSFTLPPSATVFTDLSSALQSTSALQSGQAPLSFYSSYGTYQPIITPYPRFLTPSPEPSILGELELELSELDAINHHAAGGHLHHHHHGAGQTGLDYESVIGANRGREDDELEEGGAKIEDDDDDEDEDMSLVWKEFNEGGGERGRSSVPSRSDSIMTNGGGGTTITTTQARSIEAGSSRSHDNHGHGAFSTSAPSDTSRDAGGGGGKRDPFEGMSLAQIRSRANSLEAVDRDASRYDAFGGVGGGSRSPYEGATTTNAAHEMDDDRIGGGGGGGASKKNRVKGKGKDKETTKGGKRKNSRGDGGAVGKKNKNGPLAPAAAANAASTGQDSAAAAAPPLASSPSTIESTSPTLTTGSEDASPNFDQNGNKLSSSAVASSSTSSGGNQGSKKNRNPHATQLPGNSQRKLGKEDAGEGHSGPICSHCGSITTPLWRRGPDDELLCNACGLYLKLHSKPRPKTFGKGGAGGSKRALNGAAAKAAASGVPPVCSNCACTSTPMWRVLEGKLSCNACSLYYKLHKVPRPASLAQKRAAAAAAKLDLPADAGGASATTAPPAPASTAPPSPGQDRPSILTPSDTSSAPTPAASALPPPPAAAHSTPSDEESGGGAAAMLISPPTAVAPLQPAVMPPPLLHHHSYSHHHQQHPPPPQQQQHHSHHGPTTTTTTTTTGPGGPSAISWTPSIWPAPSNSISPFQDAVNPFAQTEWGRLAYQLVSAAAEEEAGQSSSTTTTMPGTGQG